jgi:hypothetical protein
VVEDRVRYSVMQYQQCVGFETVVKCQSSEQLVGKQKG